MTSTTNRDNSTDFPSLANTFWISVNLYGCFRKCWYPQISHFNRVFYLTPTDKFLCLPEPCSLIAVRRSFEKASGLVEALIGTVQKEWGCSDGAGRSMGGLGTPQVIGSMVIFCLWEDCPNNTYIRIGQAEKYA